MKWMYFWIANIIFAAHIALGIFFLTGWYFDQVQLLYVAAMLAWMGSWVVLGYCPVSYWEFWLRNKYNEAINPDTDIIKHYLHLFFGISVTERFVFNTGAVVFSFLLTLAFVY